MTHANLCALCRRLTPNGIASSWLALLFFIFITSSAHAQLAPLGVGPLEINARVPRTGARLSGAFSVINGGSEPLHVTAYPSDWTVSPNGSPRVAPAGTVAHSCAEWITLNPRSFTLPPNGKTIVRYSISPPAELVMQHHALVFFESRPVPLPGESNMKISITTRMGAKVFVSPAVALVPLASLAGITAGANAGDEPKLSFKNEGLTAVRAKGTVEARDAAGTVVATGELTPGKVQVLAGSTVELAPKWVTRPAPGTYTVRFIVDYGVKALLAAESTLVLTAAAPPEVPEAPAAEAPSAQVISDTTAPNPIDPAAPKIAIATPVGAGETVPPAAAKAPVSAMETAAGRGG